MTYKTILMHCNDRRRINTILAPAVKGWGFRQSSAPFARIGVAALVVYLGVCTVSHWIAVERVERRYPDLIGGAGVYPDNGAHGPFIHIDARGYRSRW